MSVTVREHLLGTIAHFSSRRARLLAEVSQLDETLKSLFKEEEMLPRTQALAFPPNEGEYAGLSVRWAIFLFVAERSHGPQPLGSIADALRAGGSTSKSANFNSVVSAVLSQMVAKGELTKTGDVFALSEQGLAAWNGIRTSEKFLNRRAEDSVEGE